MRYHAKKSIAMLVTTVVIATVIGYFMVTNYPDDGLLLGDVAKYYSLYLILLLVGIVLNRVLMSGIFRGIHFKQKEDTPWKKDDQDILVEYQGVLNVFIIAVIGLLIGLALLYFKQPLPWFFIVLFLVILGVELTYWLSVFMYNRNVEEVETK